MHNFLKSIGFENIKTREEEETLIKYIIDHASDRQLLCKEEDVTIAELSMEFAPGAGITVCGEYDKNDHFYKNYYYPFYKGKNVSTREEIFISKRIDTDAFTGMCDDYRLGVSLIFYLQNSLDYLCRKESSNIGNKSVLLSGLAQTGKILLPVNINSELDSSSKAKIKYRNQLIAEAKKGNQEAIDSLTIDDIDLYALVSKRVLTEDIYSIVETSFIPYGSESDNYTILGNITDVKEEINTQTEETLFIMTVESNHLSIDVCINQKNLFGEPAVGRRFIGNIWLQGMVEFLD